VNSSFSCYERLVLMRRQFNRTKPNRIGMLRQQKTLLAAYFGDPEGHRGLSGVDRCRDMKEGKKSHPLAPGVHLWEGELSPALLDMQACFPYASILSQGEPPAG
jgi:hypothetical protein